MKAIANYCPLKQELFPETKSGEIVAVDGKQYRFPIVRIVGK